MILASVASVYVFRSMDDAKRDAARASMKSLTDACMQYHNSYGEWPQSLQALVQPPSGKPFIEGGVGAITDPWGKPYNYNPSCSQNLATSNVEKPDISCTDSDGQQIGNWQSVKK